MKEIEKKLLTEPVYLFYDFEDFVLRTEPPTETDPELKHYVKPKGLYEYPIAYSSVLVTEIFLTGVEITKEEYDAY